ncbi:MAG: LytR C-terminal domain-containing protein [Undibacterium sp.]
MPAKKSIPEAVVPDLIQEKKGEEVSQSTPAATTEIAEPNEAFFGTLLIGCLALSLIAASGYFAFSGYRYLKSLKAEESIPSIAQLPVVETEKSVMTEVVEEKGETKPNPETKTQTVDKKTVAVKVLNGGAAKGVAGAYVEKLKKDGFTKATVGNSFGNYIGAVMYYAKGQETSVAVLKEMISKDYPALLTKEAESGNKDTTAAPIVLILGR